MNDPEVSWDLHRSFLAVLREGSLSAAARSLSLTQPTVGRHVDALEKALATALFTRSRNGLSPTPAALNLQPHAEAMAAAAAAVQRTASGEAESLAGTVRLAASEAVGSDVLPSVLGRFRDAHPLVALELVTSDRMTNLLTREADIAVRMTRPTQGSLVARRLGTVHVGLYASRRYVAVHGLPEGLDELTGHSAVGYDRDAWLYESLSVDGLRLRREMFDFRTDNHAAQMAAVRAGLGIGGMQRPVADTDPDLVPVLPELVDFELEMWLAMHEDLRGSARVRTLFEFLGDALADYCRGKRDPPDSAAGELAEHDIWVRRD